MNLLITALFGVGLVCTTILYRMRVLRSPLKALAAACLPFALALLPIGIAALTAN